MITQEVLEYINRRTKEGATKEDITSELLLSGWREEDIKEAFASSKGHPRLLPTILGLVIGIFLVGSGAAAFWYFVWKEPPPEEVVAKMFESLQEIKSVSYAGRITVQASTQTLQQPLFDLGGLAGLFDSSSFALTPPLPEEDLTVLSVDFEGASDAHDPTNQKAFLNGTINVQVPLVFTFRLGIESRVIGNTLYMRLTHLDSSKDLSSIDPFINPLKNQWIEIDPEEIAKQLELDELQEELEELKKELEGTSKNQFTEEETRRLMETLTSVFVMSESLPSELIDEIDTYHYTFSLNKAGLRQYFLELVNILQAKKSLPTEQVRMLKELLEAPEFDEALETIVKAFQGDIWIGKDDFLPYRTLFQITIPDEQNPREIAKISMRISWKDYNQPVTVQTPSNVKTLTEIMTELFGDLSLTSPAGDGKIHHSTDPSVCARAFFSCEEGFEPFNDETGCGCQPTIEAQKAICEAEGGEWTQAGLAQEFRCVHAYADGGKSCTSSDECMGLCIVEEENGPSFCKHNDNPFGCYASVEDYRADNGILCID